MTDAANNYKGLGIAGMVLGICSVVFFFWLGFILGVLAIIFSAISLQRKKNGQAIAGLVTGIIGVLASIVTGAFIVLVSYAGITSSANAASIEADASSVLKYTEIYAAENGEYPDYDTIRDIAEDEGIIVEPEGQGGDVVYIPCYGDGAILWYWQEDVEEYGSLYAGDTYSCEWKDY